MMKVIARGTKGQQSKENALRTAVMKDGFAFIPALQGDEPSEIAISRLGSIEQVSNYDDVHDLIPREATAASRNTYSGNFGLSEFPLHTDFAHWFIPPRYLVLRCIIGADEVTTRLFDSRSIIQAYGSLALGRALVRPRTPINGQRPLLKLFDACRGIFRWDPLFLLPASPHGVMLSEDLGREFEKLVVPGVVLKNPGDTLVIDNWRYLHGRSPVPEGQRSRKIHRAYLSSLH